MDIGNAGAQRGVRIVAPFARHRVLVLAGPNGHRVGRPLASRVGVSGQIRSSSLWSLGVGLLMFVIKVGSYLLTGSAAILSDAAESVVHVAAVAFAAYSLKLSYRPPDDTHLYGHAKITFFSAGFEGAMIVLAALGALGGYLVWLGRRKNSLILVANGKHVLTDCWTSIAVLVGLGLVLATGWLAFDPVCGILMALNILRAGGGLIWSAFSGLMDSADPAMQKSIAEILERETARHEIGYHQLRHRNVGDAQWADVHLLFPKGTSLEDAHRVATEVKFAVAKAEDNRVFLTTHLECADNHEEMHSGAGPGGYH